MKGEFKLDHEGGPNLISAVPAFEKSKLGHKDTYRGKTM